MSVSLTHLSWWLWSGKHQEPKRLSNEFSLNPSQDLVVASISSISIPNSPQAAALLANEDVDESSSSSSRRGSTFLNVVVLGNDRLSKGASSKSRGEIYLKLQTITAPLLKLVDFPGLDQRIMDETLVSDYAQHNDAILLVIVPTTQAPKIASSRAFKIVKEYDGGGTEHG
ncbi:hypothetical protein PVL29_014720 [Vitis rotundifolia]|uniref:Dynamin N-terminal domain-containing protein n=1 Tax=Vitis rotundifolia TaxID=103349 RepID=A0AA39DP77_VITRO|nr:hypothetical protein PVL29_014720 [Vitis rotundifolia]